VPVTHACVSNGIAGIEKSINLQSSGSIFVLISSNGGALFVEI